MFNYIHPQEPAMERIAAAATHCFYVDRDEQREIMEKKTISAFAGILKDFLVMSVVLMLGAALTLLFG